MVIVKQYTLLTMKPIIYVANLGEEDLEDPSSNPHYNKVVEFAAAFEKSIVLADLLASNVAFNFSKIVISIFASLSPD